MKAILEDNKISLRALDPTDLDIMLAWENDTRIWDIGNTITPYSRQQLWEYLQNYDGDIYKSRQLRLMITLNETKEPIGTIDFYDFDPFNNRSAIGLLIDEKYQNQGYGKRALILSIEYALNFLGLHQCIAIVPTENIYSKKLFDSVGFQNVGLMKDWLKIGQGYKSAYFMQIIVE